MGKRSIALTRREEELMDFLWAHGKPTTSNEILEQCRSHTWSESYLHVMIRSLLDKGMLEQVGSVQYGTQYARLFRCTMTKEEYFVVLAAGKGLDKGLFAHAAVTMAAKESPKARAELVEQLEKILQEFSERE